MSIDLLTLDKPSNVLHFFKI